MLPYCYYIFVRLEASMTSRIFAIKFEFDENDFLSINKIKTEFFQTGIFCQDFPYIAAN